MTDLAERFPNVPLNLEILAEECAEVIQIKSKIIRFGIDDYHPKNGAPNRECLVQEIGDVLAMVGVLVANGLMTDEELLAATEIKLAKLGKYYELP